MFNIRTLRRKFKLSQQKLEEATGIPKGRINGWEQRKTGPSDVSDIKMIRKFLIENKLSRFEDLDEIITDEEMLADIRSHYEKTDIKKVPGQKNLIDLLGEALKAKDETIAAKDEVIAAKNALINADFHIRTIAELKATVSQLQEALSPLPSKLSESDGQMCEKNQRGNYVPPPGGERTFPVYVANLEALREFVVNNVQNFYKMTPDYACRELGRLELLHRVDARLKQDTPSGGSTLNTSKG